ncbi:sulfite exporter TauE/SafE family protein [Sediminibacterium roseum]|uniref:Probable membrane transporter protein n=1 Tax=Sediminibacterium roseum TaxID=1978412 RepID=A0ABX0A002_9BACT|nr:sulfite exporter TauE/SafE family protein [Sediminibacterium roseum]NCI50481.1 sulfite exporter TauE/SafE family protein [Sediminibacterium roseum]
MTFTIIVLLVIVGLVAGFLSGLVGIGGGVIIVPALVILLGFSQKLAQGTSLGILLLPVGILGVIQYYKQGYLNVNYVLIISAAFILGSFLGGKLALSLSEEKMKKIFAVVMMLIAVKMLFFDRSKPAPPKDQAVSSTKIQQTGL